MKRPPIVREDEPQINLLKDERGSVMVEFVLVSPFLLFVMMGIFFFTDLNRFQLGATYLANVQSWKYVAEGRTDGESSGDFSFVAPAGLPGIGMLNQILGYGTLNNVLAAFPPVYRGISGGADLGIVAASYIYLRPDLAAINGQFIGPFTAHGMPLNTWFKEPFRPSELGLAGVNENNVIYRNSDFLGPIVGAANSFVGDMGEQSVGGAAQEWQPTQVSFPMRMNIMSDSFSALRFEGVGYYAQSYNGESSKLKRIDRIDRYTANAWPHHMVAGIAQTMISGNLVFIATFLAEYLDPLGVDYFGIQDDIAGFPAMGFLDTLGSIFEQAQPFRKVDKWASQRHDVQGKIDERWSETDDLQAHNLLKSVSATADRWKMIQ